MCPSGWSSDRRRLEREIASAESVSLFQNLWPQGACSRCMESWLDVEAMMKRSPRDAPWKDRVITALLGEGSGANCREWQSILMLLFWDGLLLTSRRYRCLDDDRRAMRVNVQWAFVEAVSQLQQSMRREMLVQRIQNDVIHNLKAVYAKQKDALYTADLLHPSGDADEEGDGLQIAATESADWVAMRRRLDIRDATRACGRLAEVGVIPRRDLPLLIGTLIYGQTLEDWAERAGITKEAAKKRRQRALAEIRRVLVSQKNLARICPLEVLLGPLDE